jgi:uncharacterized circularly permuted ATP-grasp superfamily protein
MPTPSKHALHGYGGKGFDELVDAGGAARPGSEALFRHLASLTFGELVDRQRAAESDIAAHGITFTVYAEGANLDRAWPMDIVPRVFPAAEWAVIEAGLAQRLTALNRFLDDLYHDQEAIAAGILPRELVESSPGWRPECRGVNPPHGVWAHICGSDLVRDADGEVYVLEDNLRVPSGVSYMLENRAVTKRVFSELFEKQSIVPVDRYPERLLEMLRSLCPDGDGQAVVLTPGIYNSAYFEHSFLARQMGVELVEGRDLYVDADDVCWVRTIEGPVRVDVIYRRVDDAFLDPEVFRPDSALGAPGLVRAWRAGKLALANAPGTGVADDKVVYTYVPDLVRFYLGEEPILGNVPTFRCEEPAQLRHVLANLEQLVVKPANEAGGKDLLIGHQADQATLEQYRDRLKANPRAWVAQPVIELSTAPTVCEAAVEPRCVDLRPFTLQAATTYVTAGGLTRVARRKGSYIVNSSQGGGSKDTWIVES